MAKSSAAEILAVTLYDFVGERADMLSFREGEVITILEQDASGWWKGKCSNGKTGIFPSNFVELKRSSLKDFPLARAIYDLPPNTEDEEQLFFEQDEVITLMKKLDENWSLGRRANGDTGRFPSKYIELTGTYNEELFQREVEKWRILEAEKKNEEKKIEAEKQALEKRFAEEARDEKEKKILMEIEKYRQEAAALKRVNERQTDDIATIKAEYKQANRNFLIKQERARRELDDVKAEIANLLKL